MRLKTTSLIAAVLLTVSPSVYGSERFFDIQSIDTMKESRDLAREKRQDSAYEKEIEIQVKEIAKTGVTHISIATPYEEEFVPFLEKWVAQARKNGLKVWFRGNVAGWEGWFNYPKITREKHTEQTLGFINKNKKLFENGDIFVSCPECENGGPGDPRMNGDTEGHRQFLINEHNEVKKLFSSMRLDVITNLYSMNGDVARLIMDKETTKSLGGVVTIDHYVETAEDLDNDINEISESSGGKIVLGELGAPILDIHGEYTDEQQSAWIKKVMLKIIKNPNVIGVNYWVNKGGSAQIWKDDNTARPAVGTITSFYKPIIIYGNITDDIDIRLRQVTIEGSYHIETVSGDSYSFPVFDDKKIVFKKTGFKDMAILLDSSMKTGKNNIDIVMYPENPSWFYFIMKKIKQLTGRL